MAAALSLQEVFMMPNFMKGDTSLLSLVSSTQKARLWFDRGCFSDSVASVRVSIILYSLSLSGSLLFPRLDYS
jgi:hypothetical protein